MPERLDTPKETGRTLPPKVQVDQDAFGKIAEGIARFMGTPRFLAYMTVFVVVWLGWNSIGPFSLRFDPQKFGFTLLTLMLSLQASYSAPLILLAQNRQVDRDRDAAEQDRQGAERNLADTEFLAREIAALRIALSEVATRDFVRGELRDLLGELNTERANGDGTDRPPGADASPPRRGDPQGRTAHRRADGSTYDGLHVRSHRPRPARRRRPRHSRRRHRP